MPDNIILYGAHVAIVATDGVEESELTKPLEALRNAGAVVDVISPSGEPIQAMQHDEKSQGIDTTMPLGRAQADDYDLVLLPGGALNSDALRMDQMARAFVRRFQEEGKPIAAICHAPWLLASAGLTEGRTLTSYQSIQDDIRNAGGTWVDQEVCIDGNLITSRHPGDIPAFNDAVLQALAARQPATAL